MSSSNKEEQEMELLAIESIYEDSFARESDDCFSVGLVPYSGGRDDTNHCGVTLRVMFPVEYPSDASAVFEITHVRGLELSQLDEVRVVIDQVSTANMGLVTVYGTCEALQQFLQDNNRPEMSMHETMMAKQHMLPVQQQQYDGAGVRMSGGSKKKENIQCRRRKSEDYDSEDDSDYEEDGSDSDYNDDDDEGSSISSSSGKDEVEYKGLCDKILVEESLRLTDETFLAWKDSFKEEMQTSGVWKRPDSDVCRLTGREIFESNQFEGEPATEESGSGVFVSNASVFQRDDDDEDVFDDDEEEEYGVVVDKKV